MGIARLYRSYFPHERVGVADDSLEPARIIEGQIKSDNQQDEDDCDASAHSMRESVSAYSRQQGRLLIFIVIENKDDQSHGPEDNELSNRAKRRLSPAGFSLGLPASPSLPLAYGAPGLRRGTRPRRGTRTMPVPHPAKAGRLTL